MTRLAPILRGSLVSTPGPGGAIGSFALPCRKLILEYNDTWPSSKGAKEFVQTQAARVAERWPSVEVVVLEKPHQHPLARGLYSESSFLSFKWTNLTVLLWF